MHTAGLRVTSLSLSARLASPASTA